MKRIVYIVSDVAKSYGLEWTAEELRKHYDLHFILLNPDATCFEDTLRAGGLPVTRIRYRGKRDVVPALIQTIRILRQLRPKGVHAHLLDAQLIGLTAARLCGIKMRIYTRHTSSYHHLYERKGVKFDRWSNRMATHIVSLSQATDRVLLVWEKVLLQKVIRIPHGFRLSHFRQVAPERIALLRKKWDMPAGQPVIGVIARHIEWKGIQYIIPAFLQFRAQHPEAVLVLANAHGPFHHPLRAMLAGLPPGAYRLLPFEEDVAALYQLFDLYVHVPIDETCEAFGQTYVEALAAGVPSVFTLSGIAADFVHPEAHAWVVPFQNSDSIAQALARLWGDQELRYRLCEQGRQAVEMHFSLDRMIVSLRSLYDHGFAV